MHLLAILASALITIAVATPSPSSEPSAAEVGCDELTIELKRRLAKDTATDLLKALRISDKILADSKCAGTEYATVAEDARARTQRRLAALAESHHDAALKHERAGEYRQARTEISFAASLTPADPAIRADAERIGAEARTKGGKLPLPRPSEVTP